MVSSFSQPEFTVTVIAMWCHMVWNPASHLIEGTKKNSRSLSTEWKSSTAIRKAVQSLWLATACLQRWHSSGGELRSQHINSSLRNITYWLAYIPTTHLLRHTSVSFLSTGSQLASERQSSLWSEPKSSVSLPSDSFKHVWKIGKDINIIFIVTSTFIYYVSDTVLCYMHELIQFSTTNLPCYIHFTNKEIKPQKKLRASNW